MRTNKVDSYPTKSRVYIQLERKKEGRMLKYFQVENDVMSFMELKKKYECILDINFH